MIYEIITNVKNGNLVRNRNLIKEAISAFENKEIVIRIERKKKRRSNPQNAFYWGVCLPLMQQALKESGNLMIINDVHELLKLRFLKETILTNEQTGEIVERIKSTTELTTSGFMDYISEITIFASEYFGVQIPQPNENITLNFD